jgi:hypothetical protein
MGAMNAGLQLSGVNALSRAIGHWDLVNREWDYEPGWAAIDVGLMFVPELRGAGMLGRVEGTALRFERAGLKGMKMPNYNSWMIEKGRFDPISGLLEVQPGLGWAKTREVLRHESVHKWFYPQRSLGPVSADSRRALDAWAYQNSHFFQGTEEIIAQWYATGSFGSAWEHAFKGAYRARGTVVTPWKWGLELGGGAAGVGILIWGAYELGADE